MKRNMNWIALTFVAAVVVVTGCTSPKPAAPEASKAAVAVGGVKPVRTGVYVSKGLSGVASDLYAYAARIKAIDEADS